MKPTFKHEQLLWKKRVPVIGLDEVGRGPLAGPVFVCALSFRQDLTADKIETIVSLGINDSKKISTKKREQIVNSINQNYCNWVVKASPVSLINKRGIVFATHEAMYCAVDELRKKTRLSSPHLLIDAFPLDLTRAQSSGQTAIISGDTISMSIAAASIIAKVSRDAYMTKLDQEFPQYGWAENKGYGTSKHRQAIKKIGITKYHRTLFVRNILKKGSQK